jgi:hypothetical protein
MGFRPFFSPYSPTFREKLSEKGCEQRCERGLARLWRATWAEKSLFGSLQGYAASFSAVASVQPQMRESGERFTSLSEELLDPLGIHDFSAVNLHLENESFGIY